jgi:hypothetical protein
VQEWLKFLEAFGVGIDIGIGIYIGVGMSVGIGIDIGIDKRLPGGRYAALKDAHQWRAKRCTLRQNGDHS